MKAIIFIGLMLSVIASVIIIVPYGTQDDEPVLPLPPLQGHHFKLTTYLGQTYDSRVEIKEGEYALIFFGFTQCPIICPTELQKFAEIMDSLPADVAMKIQPIFITLDPERDTPQALADYIPLFHRDIIGLTDTPETIQRVLNDWNVYYKKIEDPQFESYTMDHSTYSYLVDHNMTIQALFRMRTNADAIKQELVKIVSVGAY